MVETARGKAEDLLSGYSEEPTPLGSYAGFMTAFGVGLVSFLATRKDSGDRALPERLGAGDIVLMGVATHKLTRIVTRDWVTAPLRAPFTSYQGSSGGGEVKERARGSGVRQAAGQLLTCPWCFAPWTASALTYGMATAPRTTRFIGSIFASVTISDFLQHLYGATRKAAAGKK